MAYVHHAALHRRCSDGLSDRFGSNQVGEIARL